MKSVSSPRNVAFAVGADWLELPENDRLYAAALEQRGVRVQVAAWNGPDQHVFGAADLVVLRATWDYHLAPDAFAAWLNALQAGGVRLANPYDLVRWNMDKRYLADLAERGALLPRQWLVSSEAELAQVLAANALKEAVLKPTIGASGHGVRLVHAATPVNEPLLVQEFVPEIRSAGQSSLVFFGGEFSHAVRLMPRSGEFRINKAFGGEVLPHDPPAEELAAARQIVAMLPAEPLYLRVDGVSTPRGFVQLEVEAIEPGLFITAAEGSAERFAAATLKWLG